MPFRLIINADDFGFSPGITDGILRCHREGILTSTTLMTTMPDRDRAIDLAGQTPTLGVGIHLSLSQGQPLTHCRRLLTRDGAFLGSLPRLILRLRSREARRQAHAELIAQIQFAQDRGLKPTHVDSHKHVCHLPALHEPLIDACYLTGIRWIRTARESHIPGIPRMSPPYRLLAFFARQLARRAAAAGLKTTDWFCGLSTTGRTTPAMYEALAQSNLPGLGELMVHPGYAAGLTHAHTRLVEQRETEMAALCDPKVRTALASAGVALVHYPQSSQP